MERPRFSIWMEPPAEQHLTPRVALWSRRGAAPATPKVVYCGLQAREKVVSKYTALRRHLEREAGSSVEMAFVEIDDVVGGLPASARRYSAWWSNEREGRHVQARAWIDAGWRVADVNLTAEKGRFTRA
jgi:hypothetical protein